MPADSEQASGPSFVVEAFDPALHDRDGFSCGVAALDAYFRRQANQDRQKRIAAVFVLRDVAENRVAGFFTLSQASLRARALPKDLLQRLPKHGILPATLIGRLAADERYRGRGIGGLLLVSALRRIHAVSGSVAAWAAVVDAKDEGVARFYARYGFEALSDDEFPRRLFLPMKTIEQLLRAEGLA